ncbi:hypothetical protein ACWCV9_30845 [Streptomyces sp. NPDC001606]
MLDDRLAVVEDWHAELWLDDAETIALGRRVWDTFAESAVFGAEAQQVIARVRRSIKVGGLFCIFQRRIHSSD